MIESYQEQVALEATEPQDASFATIGTVHGDGVTLIFDGEAEATAKHYKCNAFCVFAAGDRVRIIKDSGTYIVEYPVGVPRTALVADEAVKLQTARAIALAGVLSGSANFNGTAGISITAAFASNAEAPIANCVDNQNSSYGDVFFRATYANELEYRVGPSGTWYKLQNQ